jgi:hypothetical protein
MATQIPPRFHVMGKPTGAICNLDCSCCFYISVPEKLRANLQRLSNGQGVIRCRFAHPLTASPTCTDRSLTIEASNGQSGAAVLDVSALDGIDNLRFSGGLTIPLAGERTRLLDSHDKLIFVDWSDVAAQGRARYRARGYRRARGNRRGGGYRGGSAARRA